MKVTIYLSELSESVVSRIYDTVELLGCAFRSPHNSSPSKLIKDEVELAAGGILLLDEAADFRRLSFEAILRALSATPLAGRVAPLAIVLRIAHKDLARLETVATSFLLVARSVGKVEIIDIGKSL